MSKINKYLLGLVCLPAAFIVQGVSAQTIEEMASAAKMRQLNMPGASAPATPNMAIDPNGINAPAPVAVKAPQSELVVTSIYTSQGTSQAGISISGAEVFVGVGDVITNGWKVDSITADAVQLKRCSSAKRCENKKLNYTFTR